MTRKKPTLEQRLVQLDDFAAIMRQRLIEEEEAGRDEWNTYSLPSLLIRLLEETTEVATTLTGPVTADDVVRACADSANYAMIIASIAIERGLAEAAPLQVPIRKGE